MREQTDPGVPSPRAAPATVRRDLQSSALDAFFFSFMTGAGEAYLPAFALAIGAGSIAAGWVSSGPMLVGALLQMVSPLAVRRFGSHRRWVVGCAALQGASFLPLIWGAWRGTTSLSVVFLCASAYWAFGMATGPAWNTWIETLVPVRIRSRYFARRSRAAQLGILLGLVFAAWIMGRFESGQAPLASFAVLFVASLLARGVSAAFLARHSEPMPRVPRPEPTETTASEPRPDYRLVTYLLVFQTSVFVASPFFTPFMLGPLGLDYLQFTLITATSFVAKAVGLPILGRLAGRMGAAWLLRLAGFGIAPLAFAWTISHDFRYLLCVQVVSGLAWAAHELAVVLLLFERIPRSQRTHTLTWFNLGNTLATVIGTGLGALLLDRFGEATPGFEILFGISSVLRLASLILIRRIPLQAGGSVLRPVVRTLAVRPSMGGIDRPVLGTLDPPEPEATRDVERGAPVR